MSREATGRGWKLLMLGGFLFALAGVPAILVSGTFGAAVLVIGTAAMLTGAVGGWITSG